MAKESASREKCRIFSQASPRKPVSCFVRRRVGFECPKNFFPLSHEKVLKIGLFCCDETKYEVLFWKRGRFFMKQRNVLWDSRYISQTNVDFVTNTLENNY